MRRIAFLSERMRLGFGTDLCIHQLARRLRHRYHVTVFASVDDGTYRGHGYDIVPWKTPHTDISLDYERQVMRTLDVVRERRPDVLVPVTFPFFGVPSKLGIPAIAYDHGVVPSRGLPRHNRAVVEYMRVTNAWWQTRAAAVVAPSAFLRTTFAPWNRRKTRVVPNGADHILEGPPLPDRAALRRRLGFGPGDVVFAFVGRLDLATPYKAVGELVELFQRLRMERGDVHLLMRGFGSELDERRLWFQGADAQASVPHERLRETLHACDVFVTTTRWEGFNLPLVEAQRLGRPVIAYRIGAHPEVVGPGAGFLVDGLDAFQARMTQLADDAALRREMGRAAEDFAGRFTWDRAADLLADVIEEVAA